MFADRYDRASFSMRSGWGWLQYLPGRTLRHHINGTSALLAAASVAAAATVGIMLMRRRSLCSHADPASNAEREAFLKVLRELSRRLFHTAREVTCIAQTVRQQLHARQHEECISALDDEWLRKEISRQCQIEEKVLIIEKEVLLQEAYTEVAFATARHRFQDHPDVKAHLQQTQQMFSDALGGKEPVLPGLPMSATLTDGQLLEIHCEIQRRELLEVRDFVTQHSAGRQLTPAEAEHVVALSSKKAERDVLEKQADLLGAHGEMYFSLKNARCRSPGFAARVASSDRDHRRAMIAALCDDKPTAD